MGTRQASSVKGTVYDLPHIQSLPTNDCNVLFVSSRTLFFIQAFGRLEVRMKSRYASQILDGGLYIIADSQSEMDQINDLVNGYNLEVFDMSCDIVSAITNLQIAIQTTACGCPVGQGEDNEAGVDGGAVPSPIGDIVYEEPAVVENRKCKASNLVHETLKNVFEALNDYNVDDMTILGLALVVGIISAVIASVVATPIAGVVVGVAGMVAVFAARLLGVTVSLDDIATAMVSNETELVCALYNASNVTDARDDYEAELSIAGLGANEIGLVSILMTNALMNILFFDTAETATFWPTYTPSVSCGVDCGCLNPAETWDLNLGAGDIEASGSTLTSEEVTPGDHRIRVNITAGTTTDNRHIRNVTLTNFVGYIPNAGAESIGFSNMQLPECVPIVELAQEAAPPPPNIETNGFYVQSVTAFTCFYEFTEA